MEDYVEDVFINCPFDEDYWPLFDAMLFTLMACGFQPRCALDVIDGSEVRIEKLFRMIAECRLAIHDLSRVQLSALCFYAEGVASHSPGLPRFAATLGT